MNWNSSFKLQSLRILFSFFHWTMVTTMCQAFSYLNNNQQQRTGSRLIFWWVREIVISFSTLPLPTFHQEVCSLCGEMYPESDYIFTSPLIPIVWATIISHVDFSYSFQVSLFLSLATLTHGLFSTEQERCFQNASQTMLFLCSKSYNSSHFTESRNWSPCAGPKGPGHHLLSSFPHLFTCSFSCHIGFPDLAQATHTQTSEPLQ